MTNAQHLIENAIMHLCRTGKMLKADINEEYCGCTLEEANAMAQHIVFSLYNGLSPNDVDRLQDERDVAVADLTMIHACWTCKHCVNGKFTEACKRCGWSAWNDDEIVPIIYEWRGLSLAAETSDKEVE